MNKNNKTRNQDKKHFFPDIIFAHSNHETKLIIRLPPLLSWLECQTVNLEVVTSL